MASTDPPTRSALAQRVYESFQGGDMDTVRSLLASDIAWHSPGQGAEHFQGIDAVMAEFGGLHGDTDGTFRVMVDEITEGDESVVVLARATGTRGERTFDRPTRTSSTSAATRPPSRGSSITTKPQRRTSGHNSDRPMLRG